MLLFFICIYAAVAILHLSCCIIEQNAKTSKTISKAKYAADLTKPLLMPFLAAIIIAFYAGEKTQTTAFSGSIQENILPQFFSPNKATLIAILFALFFGTCGDILLLSEKDKKFFISGLCAFLLGHFSYLSQYIPLSGMANHSWLFYAISAIVYALGVYGVYLSTCKPKGFMGFSIVFYSAALAFVHFVCFCLLLTSITNARLFSDSAFSGQIAEISQMQIFLSVPQAIRAFIGATCFVISDNLLAVRIFRKKFPLSRFLIMAFYIAAQILLATALF